MKAKKYPFSKEVETIVLDGITSSTPYSNIAKSLNKAGLRTVTGRPWTHATVSHVAIALGYRKHNTQKGARRVPVRVEAQADIMSVLAKAARHLEPNELHALFQRMR